MNCVNTIAVKMSTSCYLSVSNVKIHTLFLDQELISYRYLSKLSCRCSCWRDLLKKAYGSVVSNQIRIKCGRNVLK